MLITNKSFYPTPESLIRQMWFKIPAKDRRAAKYILEPQAGAGHIVDFIWKQSGGYYGPTVHAIEKDPELVGTLRGKKINVIDYDFLTFCGSDKYDIIIGNPPFDNGELHLLKAIDILYSGNIVFLLNAQTLKNPCTNQRKLLLKKLEEFDAEIEYLTEQFAGAERPTMVEIALIHIRIERKIENDLFRGMAAAPDFETEDLEGPRELVGKDLIHNLVADYNRVVKIGTQALLDFYKNHRHLSAYLKVVVNDEKEGKSAGNPENLTVLMKGELNLFLKRVRQTYWQKVLSLEKVEAKMTKKKKEEFKILLQQNELMDFTESNIHTFIVNLARGYEDILTDAVASVFDKMTIKHAWDEEIHFKNVHYFDGWKTNKAFFVNKKVIIPFYGNPFWSVWGKCWEVSYSIKDDLNDIDKVMNYFDGRSNYVSIVQALTEAFGRDQASGVESTYFRITVFKKGTIHLTFLNDDIRRRFNVTACKRKNWLPMDYGKKAYADMSQEEKAVVGAFEGQESYAVNALGGLLFQTKNLIQIEYYNDDHMRVAA